MSQFNDKLEPCGEDESVPPQQRAKVPRGMPPIYVPMRRHQLLHGRKRIPFAGKIKSLVPGADASRPSSIPLIIPNNMKYDVSSQKLMATGKARTKLEFVPEALQLLKAISKPVAVLGICGPARSGKSYILSKMLGCPDAFALGHSFDQQTFGIWLGTCYLDFDEYAMLLLDTEGIDNHAVDAKGEDDIGILVMTVLLTSYLIYNSRGSLETRDIDTMRSFTRLAKAVVVNEKSTEQMRKGSGGMDGASTEEYRCHFPKFLWLLRDSTLEFPGDKPNPKSYMVPLFKKTDAGKAILSLFPSVDCMLLPPPGDFEALRQVEQEECENKLDNEFTTQVAGLLEYLGKQVEEKKGFSHGQRVNGTALAHLAEIYLQSVNDGTQLCLEGSWSSAVEIACSSLIEKYSGDYVKAMEKIKLPVEEEAPGPDQAESLMQVHSRVLQQKKDEFIAATKYYVPIKDGKEWRYEWYKKLKSKLIQTKPDHGREVVTGGILLRFITKNYKISEGKCIECFDRLFKPTLAYLERSHTTKESKAQQQYSFEQYMEDCKKLRKSFFKDPDVVGPAKEDVWEKKLKEAQIQKLESEVEYRNAQIKCLKKQHRDDQEKAKKDADEALNTEKERNKLLPKKVRPSLPPSSSSTGAGATEDTLGVGDLFDIKCYLQYLDRTNIYNLGLALGLNQPKVKRWKESDTFLDDVLVAWLKREDDVEKKGMPGWRTLVRALRCPIVSQVGVANDICRDIDFKE